MTYELSNFCDQERIRNLLIPIILFNGGPCSLVFRLRLNELLSVLRNGRVLHLRTLRHELSRLGLEFALCSR